MKNLSIGAVAVWALVGLTGPAAADTWGHKSRPEARIQDMINQLRGNDPLLRGFLEEMPKGADLHSHFSGAITMEKLIQWGAEDGMCVDTTTFVASAPPCEDGQAPMAETNTDRTLYDNVLMAWSMEGFEGPLLGAHQHFFDTFGKFGAVITDDRADDALADILSTAGKHHQIYVELMQGFNSSSVGSAAAKYFQPGDPWNEEYLLQKRAEIIADPVFAPTLDATVSALENTITGARALLGCDAAMPDPGCQVEPRFLLSANRTRDRGQVFAQWVYAFELAQAAPTVLGVNLVSPEEHPNSLLYYDDEMLAVDVLYRFNKSDPSRHPVRVSLHVGELIPEVLPQTPDGRHLTFHIRNAVDIAHAERIGHGADVLSEVAGPGVQDLFRTLRKENVLIEICLTSNATLLGLEGKTHPLRQYLRHHVPVALATDDLGVLRNDITAEYQRAVTQHKVQYPVLKDMVRASLEHSFLPGASLWRKPNRYDQPVQACRNDDPVEPTPSGSCSQYLAGSERAAMQWKLEGEFRTFERALGR